MTGPLKMTLPYCSCLHSSYFGVLILLYILSPVLSIHAFPDSNLVHHVLINGVPVENTNDTFVVNSSDNIGFLFSTISDSSSYKYCLSGIKTPYKTIDSHYVYYANLSIGTFEFRVNTDYKDDTEINMLKPKVIVVDNYFLDSWGFMLMVLLYILLLIGGASYFIILSNYRNKIILEDLRNDWANKLHNDIGADLSSVGLHIQSLNRKLGRLDPSLKERVKKMLQVLMSIQNKLRFVFDLVDPKKSSMEVMLTDIELFAIENFTLQHINFTFDNHLEFDRPQEFNIGQINKIYLVMKEAIHNAVKHSKASNAAIQIVKVEEGISISIQDDGVGFDSAKDFEGNGIDNLKQYGREGFIDIQINSAPNKGTTITILVPEI